MTSVVFRTAALLMCSNVFMTFAYFAHRAHTMYGNALTAEIAEDAETNTLMISRRALRPPR